MPEKPAQQHQHETKKLNIQLPCQVVKWVERYASETGTDFTGVLIEAVDQFLRSQNETSPD